LEFLVCHDDGCNFHHTEPMFVCCLFVGMKPEKLYSASCWEGSNPPGSDYTRQRHKPRRAYQTQRHDSSSPRTAKVFFGSWVVMPHTSSDSFWFLVCYTATQLATQLRQRCFVSLNYQKTRKPEKTRFRVQMTLETQLTALLSKKFNLHLLVTP